MVSENLLRSTNIILRYNTVQCMWILLGCDAQKYVTKVVGSKFWTKSAMISLRLNLGTYHIVNYKTKTRRGVYKVMDQKIYDLSIELWTHISKWTWNCFKFSITYSCRTS